MNKIVRQTQVMELETIQKNEVKQRKLINTKNSLMFFGVLFVFCCFNNIVIGQTIKRPTRVYSLEYERMEDKQLVQQKKTQLFPEVNFKKLRENLKSTNGDERLNAAEMAGYFPESNTTTELENLLLTDKSSDVRQQCAISLLKIADKKSIPTLISALKDNDWKVKFYSALTLADLGEKEKSLVAANELWDKGRTNIPFYSYHLVFRDLATPEAINNLIYDLNDTDPYVAVDAAICLAQIGQSTQAFPYLQQFLNNQDKYIRMAAIRGLAYIGDDVSLELIRSKTTDENNLVRNRANLVIENFNNNVNQ